MELTYNTELRRYEFRCTREERDRQGRLGFAIATSARFKPQWNGRDPYFVTSDPYKALQLSAHASDELRVFIQEAVKAKGGGVPVLTFKNNVYIWSGPQYSEDGRTCYKDFPKRAGFAFTKTPYKDLPRQAGSGMDEPVWWTEQHTKAAMCAEYADEPAQLSIGSYMARKHAALQASRAEDSDIEIPVPEGLTPRGFQRAGVAYFLPRKRVLCGDEMGLGKTVQAALWVNKVDEIKTVLVVCPASLKRNWMYELERWLVRPTTIGIADTRYNQVVPPTDIVIINYDILARKEKVPGETKIDKDGKVKPVYKYILREALTKRKWDLLVVDECHRLKGDPKQVIRSRMTFALEAERMLFLSGTPLVNRPRELWNLVHHLAPKAFPHKAEFMNRYCAGGNPEHDPYGGAKNLAELQEKLRLWIMIRRLKKDVLKDLPPKMRQVIELPADGCENLVKNEMLAFARKEDVLTTMRLRVELAKASENPEDYKQAVSKLTDGIKVAFEELSRVRRETAVAKIPLVADHLDTIFEEGHKVILFCHHKDVAYALAYRMEAKLTGKKQHIDYAHLLSTDKRFLDDEDVKTKVPKFTKGKAVVAYTGDHNPMTDRPHAVKAFQDDKDIRLFIGTIGAAGVGLTLTASSYVVFAELDWVPGNVTQAEDRAHRIGQSDNVLVQHLVLEGSLDKRMADVLVEKQDIADRALNRETTDELLEDPVMPEREKMATQGVTIKEVARIAEKMSGRDIEAVHMGLRLLAGTHKDAGLLEGLTFREVDAALGKTLASHKTLTPRMAALGKKFLSRYRNTQLAIVPEIQQLFEKEIEK